eukprot:jgi/Mesvir1/2462/Mv25708-RA.1
MEAHPTPSINQLPSHCKTELCNLAAASSYSRKMAQRSYNKNHGVEMIVAKITTIMIVIIILLIVHV